MSGETGRDSGKRFISLNVEAVHRHNWPAHCIRNKRFKAFIATHYPPQPKGE